MKTLLAEYIWIDGTIPTAQLRSKIKVIRDPELLAIASDGGLPSPSLFPSWGADGSSTNQATGANSDIGLSPCRVVPDPFRPGNFLVLCEVTTGAGDIHPSNTRAELRRVLEAGADRSESLFGFEQEYTFLTADGRPLGFPENGFPGPQGPYYCAVGTGNIVGRAVYEAFITKVLAADLAICGFNWEVMPGQAEYQVGAVDPLTASDHVWLARWIIQRVAEDHDVVVSFKAKPAKGDWNGAGMHTNFSTKEMRAEGGMRYITAACDALGEVTKAHLAVYGDRYEERLTGAHETCSFSDFRYGVADRTASIRIPRHVGRTGRGYLEDRRPNANADPYAISARMLRTVCEID